MSKYEVTTQRPRIMLQGCRAGSPADCLRFASLRLLEKARLPTASGLWDYSANCTPDLHQLMGRSTPLFDSTKWLSKESSLLQLNFIRRRKPSYFLNILTWDLLRSIPSSWLSHWPYLAALSASLSLVIIASTANRKFFHRNKPTSPFTIFHLVCRFVQTHRHGSQAGHP
jgi:hypothetical protein